MNNCFEKIVGYENEKKSLMDLCNLLKKTDKFKKLKIRMPKGIMLVGKPGVGKTVLAKAFIQESGLNCVKVNFDDADEDDVAEYLQEKFREAIDKGPSIIFIDELDKFCGENGMFGFESNISATRKIIKAIDDNESDKVLILATINEKEMVSSALCRSGRFDRIIEIPLPTLEDRRKITEYYARGKDFDNNVNFDDIAKTTSEFSGADIECIINEAGLNAVISDREVINQNDIDKAINRIVFHATEKDKPVDGAKKRIVAVHEVGHLIVGLLLDKENIGNITIIPQGNSGGHLEFHTQFDGIKTKSEMLDLITISLAGKAAESVFYPNEDYLGSRHDIFKAFETAQGLITEECCYGFEYNIKQIEGQIIDRVQLSDKKIEKIENKCNEIIAECYEKAKRLINENIDLANVFIERIIEKHTLDKNEIFEIYNNIRQSDKK